MNVRIKRLSPLARIPSKKNSDDAGWDFYATQEITIGGGEVMPVPTDIALEIPVGWYLQLFTRSGMGLAGFSVEGGVIDCGYRKGVTVILRNGVGNRPHTIRVGDKIAQGVFLPVPAITLEDAGDDQLSDSERGPNGLGSSGR